MTDEQRRVLHQDLDRIIDGGAEPAILPRHEVKRLQRIEESVIKAMPSIVKFAQTIPDKTT